jgi:hypothetical protein
MMRGTLAFASRWHSPADAQLTMRELMTFVFPPMERWGYDLTQRWDRRLRFDATGRPRRGLPVPVRAPRPAL